MNIIDIIFEKSISRFINRRRRKKIIVVSLLVTVLVLSCVLTGLPHSSVAVKTDNVYGTAPQTDRTLPDDSRVLCALSEDARHTHTERCYTSLSGASANRFASPNGEELVTLTFAINNADYTNDPGSGITHITTEQPIEDSELTFEQWAGRYKVLGTGMVSEATIPAGTSLKANGLSLPVLNIENIGDSTHYYDSIRSWVTPDNLVCGPETVFDTDTTLYLSLYEDNAYSLDFICCDVCESYNSFSYYMTNGYLFKLGQRVSGIPSFDTLAQFTENNHNHDGKELVGWQLRNTQTGEYVPLTSDVSITSDYVNEQYGRSIKCYAMWDSSTVTFRNGDVICGTYEVEKNMALGSSIPPAPTKSGYFFSGWRADGVDGYANADTVITDDITFSAVFLSYADAPRVEFVCSDNSNQTNTVYSGFCPPGMPLSKTVNASGAPLSALPTAPERDSLVFRGWYTTILGSSQVAANMDMIVLEDTTFIADYCTGYDVTLHDIDVNGEETETKTLYVAEGMTLAEALDSSGENWLDGAALSDCIWYNGDGNTYTPVNTQDVITGDSDLYTFSHRITLHLSAPVQRTRALLRAAPVTVDGDTITIDCREGEKLKASDFVVDGKDLSVYSWTTQDDSTVTLSELIGQQITEPMTLVRGDTVGGIKVYEGQTVSFYVFVNEERVLLGEDLNYASYYVDSGSDARHYLSAAQLEEVYGDYGFTAEMLTEDTYYFPHVNKNKTNIWADTPVLTVGDKTFSAITTGEQKVDVYYFPEQSLAGTNGQYAGYVTDNSFYTVDIIAPDDTVTTTICKKGNDVNVTVPSLDDYRWTCSNDDSTDVLEPVYSDIDNTYRFTIHSINSPYTVTAIDASMKNVYYTINMPAGKAPIDSEYGTPTIGGDDHYSVEAHCGSRYTLLAPSLNLYRFKHGKKYLGMVEFKGWQIDGTETVLQPGDSIDLMDYDTYSISLVGVWEVKAGGDYDQDSPFGSVVNYFVSLAAFPEGSTSIVGSDQANKFTDSVFSSDCGVSGSDVKAHHLYKNTEGSGDLTQYYVLGSTNIADIYRSHDTLTTSLSEGYTMHSEKDGNDYTFSADFPSDEEVLREVRNKLTNGTEIYIYDHKLLPEEVTTAAFTIKWYVFKWEKSDGWHIDGYLIARKGMLRIQKDFGGDEEVIEAVKQNFSITVAAGIDGSDPVYLPLDDLTIADATKISDTQYQWEIETDLYYRYLVSENNYIYNGEDSSDYTSLAAYRIYDPIAYLQTTHWEQYNPGDPVAVYGRDPHEDGYPLTVIFGNLYVRRGEVVLQKIDAASDRTMEGVAFTLDKVGDPDFTLYDIGGNHYTYNAEAGGIPITDDTITDITVVTNKHGQIYLELPIGSYTLLESNIAGYQSPGTITFDVTSTTAPHGVIGSAGAVNGTQFVDVIEQCVLCVKNYSRNVSLSIKKTWLNPEEMPGTSPVKLQLCRNGVTMGKDYEVTLNGIPNEFITVNGEKIYEKETTAWECTFIDVPLKFEDDNANYTVREVVIGDFYYSDEYESGYSHYDVTYRNITYYDSSNTPIVIGAGETVDDYLGQIDHMSLDVDNRFITYDLSLLKTDENESPVDGAQFKLFLVKAEETDTNVAWDGKAFSVDGVIRTKAAEGLSNTAGEVTFGTMGQGMYYLIESASPEGYRRNNAIYRVKLDRLGNIELKQLEKTEEGDRWIDVENNTIINSHITGDVTIKKHDENNAFIPGAEFRLQRKNKAGEYVDIGSPFTVETADGTTIPNLMYGDYRLLETIAPRGYYKQTTPVDFSVIEDGVFFTNTDRNASVITIVNHPGSVLPKTGGVGTEPLTSVGIIIMLLSVVLYKNMWRRKAQYDC